MSDVAASVDVRVPVRTAYNQWTQFESFPAFMTGVVAVQQLNNHATHWVTEIDGAHREFDAEIIEQRPDERIAWQSTDGDLQHSGTVTFEPLSTQETRVTVDLAWEPRGVVEKVGSTIGVDQLQVKRDLLRFKEFIEERGVESGQWRGQVPAPPAGAPVAAGRTPDTTTGMTTDMASNMATSPMQPSGYGTPGYETPGYGTPGTQQPPAMQSPSTQQQPSGYGTPGYPAPGTQQPPATQPASPVEPQPTSLPPSYDVVDVLRTQHEQVKRMLAQTEAATGPAKQQHFQDLLTLLELHEKGERQVVHPVTRSTGAAGDRTAMDRIGEERKAEEMITGLKMADVGTPEFDAQFARLRDAVLKHAQQEETEEFPRLRRDVAPEQLRAMAEQLLALQGGLS